MFSIALKVTLQQDTYIYLTEQNYKLNICICNEQSITDN